MKRLTVHLSDVKKIKEKRKDSNGNHIDKEVIHNTLSYKLSGLDIENQAMMIIGDLEKDGKKVSKHYLTNLV